MRSDQNNTAATRPNVIWIFGDQHRAQATGYRQDPNAFTPNMDNLAASGIDFSRAVSGYPLCCPARGAFLTGCYPHKVVPGHEHPLSPDQPTIAHVFNDAGYRTAYYGKWHLDGFHESGGRAAMHIIPPERRGGFQRWLGYENNNSQWDCWVQGGEGDSAFHERLSGYETDELTTLFINYLQEQQQLGESREVGEAEEAKPFFAVLSVQPPHNPYIAPENVRRHYTSGQIQLRPNVPEVKGVSERARRDLAGYYAMIENLDWNIGRIMQALRDTGLLDTTHVLFFSDHGDMHGSHGQFRKQTPYEESIRVPFLIGGETSFYDGRKTGMVTAPLNHVDVAPTTLGLCGIDKPQWMEGTDYSGYRLATRPLGSVPDSAFLQCIMPTRQDDGVDQPWRGVVTADGWKYIVLEGVPWLMFDLNEDPYEQVNLAHNHRYSDMRKKLNERLREWISQTADQFAVPRL